MYMFRETVYIPKTFFVVVVTGTILVFISKVAGMRMERDHRTCRAWCSRFSLGTQPHSVSIENDTVAFLVVLLAKFLFPVHRVYIILAHGLQNSRSVQNVSIWS